MAEIVILGSGSGFATADRFCTSIAILTNDCCYLLDCGDPAAASMFRCGIDPLSTRAIFISHLHPDHIGGLASVLFSMYLPGRASKKKFKPWSITRYDPWYREALDFPTRIPEEGIDSQLDIFLPAEGIEGIRAYLETVYLAPVLLPFALELGPVETGVFFTDQNITVSSIGNQHMLNNFRYQSLRETHPRIRLQSYSFRVEVEGKTIVFSGDIDHINELAPLMADVNLLMVEVAHYDPEDIKPFFDRYPVDQLLLIHIHPGLESRIKSLVEEWDDPRIRIATDGYRVVL